MSGRITRRPLRIATAALLFWSCLLTNALAADDPPPIEWPRIDAPASDSSGDPPAHEWPSPQKP